MRNSGFGKRESMKKSIKSLVALMLALVIALAVKPISAEAAVSGIRTNAAKGKKYTITSTYPGGVKLKANVKFTDVNTVYYKYSGFYETTVNAKVTFPKSEIRKVQNNVHKIVTSAPYVKTIGNDRQYKGCLGWAFVALDANTGKVINNARSDAAAGISVSGQGYKIYRQDNARMGFYKGYNVRYTLRYYPSAKGQVLIGIAGHSKPIYDNNKNYKKFAAGKASFTKTALYSKKKKNLSIFMKF
jgi:hypothetical protein